MSLFFTSATTIGSILAVMAVISLIEMAIPLHARGPAHRAHVRPNLALTFITFASNIVLNTALVLSLVYLDTIGFGILRWTALDPVLAGVLGFVLLDFSYYVAHVAMHRWPAFWRVHRVHHSDPVLDVTTTIRQHPLEGIIRYAFMAAFACMFGVGIAAFVVYRTWSAIIGLLEHANMRVPRWLGATLSLVTTWPTMHKVHHSRDLRESRTNYGNIFSWFDRIFGTFTPAWRGERVVCGVDGLDDPRSQTLRGLLAMPFQPLQVSGGAAASAAAADRAIARADIRDIAC
jgi:sterol desaturase/sphingolipid hydroxylase (fatty acid hydroxylase superfamily)